MVVLTQAERGQSAKDDCTARAAALKRTKGELPRAAASGLSQ